MSDLGNFPHRLAATVGSLQWLHHLALNHNLFYIKMSRAKIHTNFTTCKIVILYTLFQDIICLSIDILQFEINILCFNAHRYRSTLFSAVQVGISLLSQHRLLLQFL